MTNQERLKRIAEIIEAVDHRASFGAIVTPTLQEMTQAEMSEVYALASQRDDAMSQIEAEKAQEEAKIFRELLWLSHGHTGQYGDDGTMQCIQCMIEYGFYDWKNTPAAEIEERITMANMRKFAVSQAAEKALQNCNCVDGRPQSTGGCPVHGLGFKTP